MASIPISQPRLSATDAIGPAFSRTLSLLVRPFFLGSFLKQALIAGIAEISYLSMMLALPVQIIQILIMSRMPHHGNATTLPNSNIHSQLIFGIVMTIFGFFALAFSTVLLYFLCRLRFVVLDLVLFGQRSIRKAWSKYGRPTWRYFGLTLLLSLAVLVVVAVVVGPIVPWQMHIAQGVDPSRPESMRNFFALFLPYMFLMMAMGILIQAFDGVARDFFLPPMGLADMPIEDCFRHFFFLLRTEPGQTVLYVILRTVLGIVFQWAASLLVILPTALLCLAEVLVGALLYKPLWSLGPGGHLLFIAYVVAAALLLLILYMIGIFAALGSSGIFKQTYAVTWLATRYPELTMIVYGVPATGDVPAPPETELPPTPPPDIAPPLLG